MRRCVPLGQKGGHMRSRAAIEWDIPEVEQAEWEDLVHSVCTPVSVAVQRPLLRVAGVVGVVLFLLFVVSGYLWMEAGRGLARIEHEMGTLVTVESVRQSNSSNMSRNVLPTCVRVSVWQRSARPDVSPSR